ncbi:MAG TPA: XdhC family protein [Gaiellaceae bacterium]|nr:XdhC family protein [Gaiellaceae bacterium]
MRDVVDWIEGRRARGERVALATVVATRRSAPRPVGAKLAVSESGELFGSVSGGCVESDVAVQAAEVIAGAAPRLLSYGIADEQAWEVGLPCGGEIDVFVQRLEDELPDPDEPAVALTVLDGERAGERRVVEPGVIGEGPSRVLELDGERVFAEVLGPPPRLIVFGAVDTAEALCRAAGLIGWRTVVVDARPGLATEERLPSAAEVLVAWPEEALQRMQPDGDTAVIVLTHEDRFDIPALKGALESDAFYVGALGSRRNQARRRERLLEEGVPEERIDRIAGPSGLDIGAESPAETALSILAEILAVRAGRAGGPLKEAKGRIHAAVD